MATRIVMEALSPTMEEGRLVEWKKKEGDKVDVGDVLAEVETDKAVMELVARTAGTLLKQLVQAGATVPVSQPVGWIGSPGETVGGGGGGGGGGGVSEVGGVGTAKRAAPAEGDPTSRRQDVKPDVSASRQDASASRRQDVSASKAEPGLEKPTAEPPSRRVAEATGRVRASPLARRIAAEQGVDLSTISGSGPEGRVVRRDLRTGERRAAEPSSRPDDGFKDVPLTQIRKTIAKRLVQSLGPIPTFYLTSEVDMERAVDAREALNQTAGDEGRISFNDIVLKAVATALRQHPACNAWWQDDHIRIWNEVHLGMAVAVEDGLITPVIRNADQKSLREISSLTRDMANRARERKLKPEEYTGATFSVSNLGMFDIEHFTAVINPPEAGILAIGSITPVPAAWDGQVTVRRRMRMTMSCDHRVIDGATGAKFLKTLKTMLENPLAMVW
jgi:pyruvate dehydrogenase E2 component (dihydrolipoamide acetyltransferase)